MDQNRYPNPSRFNNNNNNPSFFQTLNLGQEEANAASQAAAMDHQALALGLSLEHMSLSSDHDNPGESSDHTRLFDFDVLGNYYHPQQRGLRINNNNDNDIGYLRLNPGSGFRGGNWLNTGQRLQLFDTNDMNRSILWNTSALNIESSVSRTCHPMWDSNNRSYYDLDCFLSRNCCIDFGPSDLHLNHQNWVSGNSHPGNVMMDNRTMVNGVNLDHVMVRTQYLFNLHRDNVRVKNLEGMIRYIAKDRRWCDILLEKMENMDNEDKETILLDIIDHLGDLMMDPYGTNVVRKFVAVCREQQRSRIVCVLTRKTFQLVNICGNKHGAEAVIKLLDHLFSPQQRASLTLALSCGIYQLSKTDSGGKVIVYCLSNLSDEENKFIFTAMVDNCYRIATEKHGCRSMQTYLSFSRGQHRDRLVAKIVEYTCSLAADQYGNYVVQYLLSWKEPQITADILQQLEGHHFALCWCKYGSNVVEQCFKSGAEQFVKVVEELLYNPGFPVLCYHEFGNYVVQAALRCAKVYGKKDIHNKLMGIVHMNVPLMRRTRSGRKALINIFE